MRNIKLTLEYDGTNFAGFQRQPRKKTIQSELEKALSKLLSKKTKIVAASGRTDSGVHAVAQVVNFKTEKKIPTEKIKLGLNHYLPHSIAVTQAKEVRESFHARYDAKDKMYVYRVWNAKVRSPLHASTASHFSYDLELKKIKEGIKILKDKHDFKAFCAARSSVSDQNKRGFVRTIKKFDVKKKGSLLTFTITADGFLYHMVRNLVGTLLLVGQEKMSLTQLKKALRSRDRKKTGPTAPACGLCLVKVEY